MKAELDIVDLEDGMIEGVTGGAGKELILPGGEENSLTCRGGEDTIVIGGSVAASVCGGEGKDSIFVAGDGTFASICGMGKF